MSEIRFHCRTCDRVLIDGDWLTPDEAGVGPVTSGPTLTCRFCTMDMSLSRHRDLIDKLRLRPLDIAGPLHLIPAETRISEAAATMRQRNTGLLGCLRDDVLVGVLSERDITRRVAAQGLSPVETRVSTVMSSPVQTLSLDASIAKAIVDMTRHGCRHLVLRREDGSYRVVSARRIAETLFVVLGEAYSLGQKDRN